MKDFWIAVYAIILAILLVGSFVLVILIPAFKLLSKILSRHLSATFRVLSHLFGTQTATRSDLAKFIRVSITILVIILIIPIGVILFNLYRINPLVILFFGGLILTVTFLSFSGMEDHEKLGTQSGGNTVTYITHHCPKCKHKITGEDIPLGSKYITCPECNTLIYIK